MQFRLDIDSLIVGGHFRPENAIIVIFGFVTLFEMNRQIAIWFGHELKLAVTKQTWPHSEESVSRSGLSLCRWHLWDRLPGQSRQRFEPGIHQPSERSTTPSIKVLDSARDRQFWILRRRYIFVDTVNNHNWDNSMMRYLVHCCAFIKFHVWNTKWFIMVLEELSWRHKYLKDICHITKARHASSCYGYFSNC